MKMNVPIRCLLIQSTTCARPKREQQQQQQQPPPRRARKAPPNILLASTVSAPGDLFMVGSFFALACSSPSPLLLSLFSLIVILFSLLHHLLSVRFGPAVCTPFLTRDIRFVNLLPACLPASQPVVCLHPISLPPKNQGFRDSAESALLGDKGTDQSNT